jgi:hypothetical protein
VRARPSINASRILVRAGLPISEAISATDGCIPGMKRIWTRGHGNASSDTSVSAELIRDDIRSGQAHVQCETLPETGRFNKWEIPC